MTAPKGRRMGHAGAIITGDKGTAQSKVDSLKDAGVTVVNAITALGDAVLRELK